MVQLRIMKGFVDSEGWLKSKGEMVEWSAKSGCEIQLLMLVSPWTKLGRGSYATHLISVCCSYSYHYETILTTHMSVPWS